MFQILKHIRELCDAKGITIYALEKELQLSHQSIARWDMSIPSADRLLKVAQYFDVSVDYLLGNTNNPKSHKSPMELNSALLEVFKSIQITESSMEAFIQDFKQVKRIVDDSVIPIQSDDSSET